MWQQKGYAVISDSEPGVPPIVHRYCQSEYDAIRERDKAEELPEELRKNIRIVPAIFRFEAHEVKGRYDQEN